MLAAGAIAGAFQFHKGTIKTLRLADQNDFNQISIP